MILLALLLAMGGAAAEDSGRLMAFQNPDAPLSVPGAHEAEGDGYFADAVFIGDSMVDDMEMFDLFPTANYVCRIGMSPLSVGRKQFRVKDSNALETTYEQAARYQPRKLYVLLGSNSLDHKTSDVTLQEYETMADELIAAFPEALIYVISPPPLTKARTAKEVGVSPGRYRNFEAGLRALAEERRFYYIDLYHLIADEEGYMPGRLSAGDGYHLNRTGYTMLADYIRTHTVPYPEENE